MVSLPLLLLLLLLPGPFRLFLLGAVVVMLTKRWEKGVEKCAHYWPTTLGTEFIFPTIRNPLLTLELIKEESHGEYICHRTLKLTYLDTVAELCKSRVVHHLAYSEWSDFGIPKSPTTILELGSLATDCSRSSKGTIAVHCSAGVGRAGTFVAIHSIIEKTLQDQNIGAIAIPETLRKLRRQRSEAVQTVEQFAFIYLAVGTGILRMPFLSPEIEE